MKKNKVNIVNLKILFKIIKEGNKNNIIKFLSTNPVYLNHLNDGNNEDEKETVIQYICEYNHIEVLKYFFKNYREKIDVNKGDLNGDTALHYAAYAGNYYIVQELLFSAGVIKINVKNNRGRTPLMDAVLQGYVDIVRLLLRYEADRTICDYMGKTALDHVSSKNKKIKNILLTEFKNINIENYNFKCDLIHFFINVTNTDATILCSSLNLQIPIHFVLFHNRVNIDLINFDQRIILCDVLNLSEENSIYFVIHWIYGEILEEKEISAKFVYDIFMISLNWKLENLEDYIINHFLKNNIKLVFDLFLIIDKNSVYGQLFYSKLIKININSKDLQEIERDTLSKYEKDTLIDIFTHSKHENGIKKENKTHPKSSLYYFLSNKLKDDEVLKDVYLVSNDNKKFHVHKLIFIGRSNFLQILFKRNQECNEIPLEMDSVCLFQLIQFIYTSKINPTSLNTLYDLFVVSERYLLEDLTKLCLKMLEVLLKSSNFINSIQLFKNIIIRREDIKSLFQKKWILFSNELFHNVLAIL